MNDCANVSDLDQNVRERAYALWEREGRPFGRHVEHWRLSEEATRAEVSVAAPPRKPKSKSAFRRKAA